MSLLAGSPLLFSPIVSFPLTLNPHPPELSAFTGVSRILIDLPIEVGVTYFLVEELGDEAVQPASFLDFLVIIPCLGVGVVGCYEFEVSRPFECDFRDRFFILCQVRALTLMKHAYGI